MSQTPYGEILESSTAHFSFECHELYGAPKFGTFVRACCVHSGRDHFAVVTQVSTGPFDGSRIVQAHRMPPGELEQRKPHLSTLLRTTVSARIVGYGEGTARVAGTPPLPPQLHCFVFDATDEEVRDLTRTPAFLRPLSQTPDVSLEDLLVGTLQTAQRAWTGEYKLVEWGKYLARLLSRDYLTLEGVLERLSPPGALPPVAAATTTTRPPRYEMPLPLAGGPRNGRDPFED